MKDFTVIFDNGGGITIQTEDRSLCCFYSGGYDYASQAAQDAKALLAGEDTSEWEGHAPEAYMEEMHRECRTLDAEDLRALLAGGDLPRNMGAAQTDFVRALTGRGEEEG